MTYKNLCETRIFADVEQNVQLSAEQLRGVEDIEQSERPVCHHEAQDANCRGQISRLTAATLGIYIRVSGTRGQNDPFLRFALWSITVFVQRPNENTEN